MSPLLDQTYHIPHRNAWLGQRRFSNADIGQPYQPLSDVGPMYLCYLRSVSIIVKELNGIFAMTVACADRNYLVFRLCSVVQFPARGSTQVLLCLFPGVLWLWHSLYSVCPRLVSSLHIYTFVMLRAFMSGAASQAGDADSSQAPGLTSGLQGSVNVHRGALLLVPRWRCISLFLYFTFGSCFIIHYSSRNVW